jgi:hypothetical protein
LGFFQLKNRVPQERGSALPEQIRASESKGKLAIIIPQRRMGKRAKENVAQGSLSSLAAFPPRRGFDDADGGEF